MVLVLFCPGIVPASSLPQSYLSIPSQYNRTLVKFGNLGIIETNLEIYKLQVTDER